MAEQAGASSTAGAGHSDGPTASNLRVEEHSTGGMNIGLNPRWVDECADVYGYARPDPTAGPPDPRDVRDGLASDDPPRGVLSFAAQQAAQTVILDLVKDDLAAVTAIGKLLAALMGAAAPDSGSTSATAAASSSSSSSAVATNDHCAAPDGPDPCLPDEAAALIQQLDALVVEISSLSEKDEMWPEHPLLQEYKSAIHANPHILGLTSVADTVLGQLQLLYMNSKGGIPQEEYIAMLQAVQASARPASTGVASAAVIEPGVAPIAAPPSTSALGKKRAREEDEQGAGCGGDSGVGAVSSASASSAAGPPLAGGPTAQRQPAPSHPKGSLYRS